MRRKKYQLKRQSSILSNQESHMNGTNQQNQQSIDNDKIRTHISNASEFRLLKLKSLNQYPLKHPSPTLMEPQYQIGFSDRLAVQPQNQQPSCIVKMSALMKVIYKSQPYRIMNIFINSVYMFGVLIQLPDQVCQTEQLYKFRCNLSYYMQVACIALIMPMFLIKMFRLVGIDSFKCIIQLTTFISGILCITGPSVIIMYVKALRCLRLLLIVRETSLIVPAFNMLTSLKSISNVLGPAILFIYIYAIIGLYSFSNNEYERCRNPNVIQMSTNWTVYDEAMYLCGQRLCPFVQGVQYECLNPIDYNVQPNEQQFNHIQFGNGLLKYSNIFIAILTTYKQTLITGSSRIILLQKQVMYFIFVFIYYYSFIYLLSYIYLNIFYGLMIVNRAKHISTKEEYEAITDKNDEYKASEVQKRLIKRYQKVFRKINKNISLFPTNKAIGNKNNSNYKTNLNISDQALNFSKRSGKNLDRETVLSAAIQHQVAKQIINIVQLKIQNGLQINNNLNSCSKKIWFVMQTTYYYFNITVVVLGSINICLDHSGQSIEWQQTINFMDLVFFILYCFDFFGRYFLLMLNIDETKGELVMKIPRRICVDGLLLSVCMTGYLYQILISQDFSDVYMAETKIEKLFRCFLYLRILVILSFEPYFQDSRKLFQFAGQAVKKSSNFMLLWLLVLMMFSLMGYFLFGGCNATENCYKPENYSASYQGVFQSIITTAVIMYNEDWDYIMYEQFPEHNYFIVVWNLIIITFGLLIISKYFMTFLLSELDTRINENFDKQNEQKVEQKSFLQNLLKETLNDKTQQNSQTPKSHKQEILYNEMIINPMNFVNASDFKSIIPKKTLINKQRNSSYKKVNFNFNSVTPQNENQQPVNHYTIRRRKAQFKKRRNLNVEINPIIMKENQLSKKSLKRKQYDDENTIQQTGFEYKKSNSKDKESKIIKNNKQQKQQIIKQKQQVNQIVPTIRESFLSLYPKTRLYIIIKSVAILIVIINFIFYFPQYDPDSIVKKIMHYSSVLVDCFFILDTIAQLSLYGVVKYFKMLNVSRLVDIIINCISIIYFTPLGYYYIVKGLYSLRCLRISYWISLRCDKSQSMRVTVKGFIQLIPKIINLLLVICLIYGFFANIIVRIYKDQMWKCINYQSTANIITKQDCFNNGGDWVQQSMNASDFINALLYIFLLSSTQDWLNTMNYLSTVQGKDLQPLYSNSAILRIFFLIFMFFANIIIMNIFVGVCINNFKQIKKKVRGETDLSKQQKQWLNIKNQIYLLQPQPTDQQPVDEFRKFFFKVTHSKQIKIFKFIQLIGLLILLSFITTNMSSDHRSKIIIGQYIFVFCGFFTCLMDILATGYKDHNKAIRVLQIILFVYAFIYGIMLLTLNLPNSKQKLFGGILVTLQLGRYFLFIQQFQFFQKMFNSLMTILPKTKDIFLLMLITLFIYTSIGMEIFGYLKPGQQLNAFNQNYVDFQNALFSLVKFSTWQEPMQQIRDGIQKMTPGSVCYDVHDYSTFLAYGQNGCGNTGLALAFFLSFHIIYSLILMPTLMGIIFDSYNQVYIDESACINKFQLMKVKQQWKKFDPQGTGYISYRDFWVLTSKIIKIYEFAHNKLLNNESRQHFLKQLNLSIYQSPQGILCFEFHELIEALTRIILIRKEKNPKRRQIFNKNATYIHEVNKKSQILHNLKKSSYDSSHVLTLILLKSGLKSWKNKTDDKMKATLFQTIQMKNKMKS